MTSCYARSRLCERLLGQSVFVRLRQSWRTYRCSQHSGLVPRRLLASLMHPNLMIYYEAFCDKHQLCIVTDLAKTDLGTFIE